MIHDAAFYAVAVPAVLMMGLSKSGFLGGFGSLAVPLMALTVPVPQAAAIMLPLLAVMDATGLQQLWRACDRALLALLLPAGLLGTVVGTLSFGVLSTNINVCTPGDDLHSDAVLGAWLLRGLPCRIDDEVIWRADGTSFPAEYSSYPVLEDGQVRGAVVTFVDISARKRAEELLKKSRAGTLMMWGFAWSATSPDGGYILSTAYGPNSSESNDARFALPANTQGNGRAHLARACVEAMAWQTADVVDAVKRALQYSAFDHNVVAQQEILKTVVGAVPGGTPASLDELPPATR